MPSPVDFISGGVPLRLSFLFTFGNLLNVNTRSLYQYNLFDLLLQLFFHLRNLLLKTHIEMKKHFAYLFNILWLIASSCQSDIDPNKSIIGIWILEKSEGGFSGSQVWTLGANTVVLRFDRSGEYESCTNDVLSAKGRFLVEEKTYTDRKGQKQTSRLLYMRNSKIYQVDGITVRFIIDELVYDPYEISATKLVYADAGMSEGYTNTYRRK